MDKMPLSAIIPSFNEEVNIEGAIDSVLPWCDEVLVIDSFSSDQTCEIARKKGATVICHPFDYHAAQKNRAMESVKNDWVMFLDADERINKDLMEEIIGLFRYGIDQHVAYWMRRENYFLGKKIRYSGWQRDRVLRLVHRKYCRYNDKLVHEEIEAKGTTGRLQNKLLHYTYRDMHQYLKKWDLYSSRSAEMKFERGIKPGLFHFVVKPAVRFLKYYIFNYGFLDGKRGVIIAYMSAMSVRMRYIKLYALWLDRSKREVE